MILRDLLRKFRVKGVVLGWEGREVEVSFVAAEGEDVGVDWVGVDVVEGGLVRVEFSSGGGGGFAESVGGAEG